MVERDVAQLHGKSVRSWCYDSSDRSFMVERDVAPW